jgi:transposase
MILGGLLKVYVARERVDLRKSYQGLSLLVQESLSLDPLSGHLFVFFNKRLDKIKVLYWDRDGFCLWQKRLEGGRFKIHSFQDMYWSMSFQDFHLLLAEIDLTKRPPRADFRGRIVG